MNTFFRLFQPPPSIEEIENSAVVKKQYKYWRIRILYSMFIGYALYYFTRNSFSLAMPGMIGELGFDEAHMGTLATIISLTYGVSKFVSGMLSDRSNPRYFMAFGLMMTGVCNLFFGFSSSLYFFILFWGLNGVFQGFGWPPCARLLTHWYSHSERGSWWSTWNVSHNVGALCIPWIVGICLQYFGWRFGMLIPGVICILGGFYLINRLRDTPQSLGLPPIEKFRNDYAGETEEEVSSERELSTKEILVSHVLSNPYIWLLAASYFFIYIVRTGVSNWTAHYLINYKDYNALWGSVFVSFFEFGGLVGSLVAGWSSDYFFRARRGPVNFIFALGIAITIYTYWFIPVTGMWVDSIMLFFLGFTIFGPQMLIGVHAAELAHKKAAATATGFIGFFAYAGAACAGRPFGVVIKEWGWEGFFIGMTLCALCSLLFLFPLWTVTDRKREKKLKAVKV